jgi:hypothetical protein
VYDILIPASKEGKLVVPPAQKGTCFSQKPARKFLINLKRVIRDLILKT